MKTTSRNYFNKLMLINYDMAKSMIRLRTYLFKYQNGQKRRTYLRSLNKLQRMTPMTNFSKNSLGFD